MTGDLDQVARLLGIDCNKPLNTVSPKSQKSSIKCKHEFVQQRNIITCKYCGICRDAIVKMYSGLTSQ